MMKIIDYVVKTSIVLAALLIMGYFFPVVSWFEKPQPRKNMVFRCEMVDGKVRGSYYVNFGSPTKNLYGKECPIDINEGCINGVLVCKRIK